MSLPELTRPSHTPGGVPEEARDRRSDGASGRSPGNDPRILEARAAWSALVEPADPVAAALVATHGPVDALERLGRWIGGATPRGLGEVPAAQVAALVARTAPRWAEVDARRDLDLHRELGGDVTAPEDPHWPSGLDDLAAPPFLLWTRGDLDGTLAALRQPGAAPVAMVGSRTATAYGQRVAADIAAHLAERGHVVVSGGAFGIDIAAHRACLAVEGRTIAVMAGGLDHVYPRAHLEHFARLEADGLLLGELPPGAEPRRHRFLTRNRVIAALCAGTIVVEAGLRSGALRTARDAMELGRPVGAVPGPVTSMMSAGCHELLREAQATLVTDGEDARELVSALSVLSTDPVPDRRSPERLVEGEAGLLGGVLDGLSPHASGVWDAMPVRAARTVAQIAAAAGLAEQDVRGALGVLELQGRVVRAGGSWKRRGASRSARG